MFQITFSLTHPDLTIHELGMDSQRFHKIYCYDRQSRRARNIELKRETTTLAKADFQTDHNK